MKHKPLPISLRPAIELQTAAQSVGEKSSGPSQLPKLTSPDVDENGKSRLRSAARMTRPRISEGTRRRMIFCLIRLPTLFRRVDAILAAEHFEAFPEYALIWRLLTEHYAQASAAPTKPILLSAAESALGDRSRQTAKGINAARVLRTIRMAYRFPISAEEESLYTDWGAERVAELITEHFWARIRALRPSLKSYPLAFPSILAEWKEMGPRLNLLLAMAEIDHRRIKEEWEPEGNM